MNKLISAVALMWAINLSSIAGASYGPEHLNRHATDLGVPTGHTNVRCVYPALSERCRTVDSGWYRRYPKVRFWEAWDYKYSAQETIAIIAAVEQKDRHAEELKRLEVERLIKEYSTEDQLQPKAPPRAPTINTFWIKIIFYSFIVCCLGYAGLVELETRYSNKYFGVKEDKDPI